MSLEDSRLIFTTEGEEQSNALRSTSNSFTDNDTAKSMTDKRGEELTPEPEAVDETLSNESENLTSSIIEEPNSIGGKNSPSAVGDEDGEMIVLEEGKQFQTRSEDDLSRDGSDIKTHKSGTGSANGEAVLMLVCLQINQGGGKGVLWMLMHPLPVVRHELDNRT